MAAEFDLTRATARLYRLMAVLAAIGVISTTWRFGWRAGAGFLLGAAFSVLNFRWFQSIVNSLGSSGSRPRTSSAIFLGLRYLLFAGVAYVTLKYFEASFLAALAGCFVAAAAVVLEIIYQLTYAP